ncbi:hypothetical protein SynA1560_01407 [Synechococcus sp. A15-60]|nr:hypothetical protein SynA1560_01407 [Synechococcus sp. A15-60]
MTKKIPAEGRDLKTLQGSVALFPPREAFFPHRTNMASQLSQ